MNIKKSIEMAMAEQGHNNSYIAGKMKMSKPSFSRLKSRDNCTMKTVEGLAEAFGMSASEFIKLGE